MLNFTKRKPAVRLLLPIFLLNYLILPAQTTIFPGADEETPSKAQYFSWINNTNEGATEAQTQTNLKFFKWLKDTYGMQLDIYAFDAGAIDGKRFYGTTNSTRFKKQFPYGFDSIYHTAKQQGIRLGIWGGPDGFGDTKQAATARIEQMVDLCKRYQFALFKFDAVCGPLRPEKEPEFIEMMERCRSYSKDLILLNHRLGLKKALPYATTFLWGGDETYIDVFMTNQITATHHRAAALSRGSVPDLKRLTEDHGVCISSCLDNWDDDLILQTFNRNLILSPEIYGNPWLLKDEEFPKLANIFNWHKQYKSLLVHGKLLPESRYGADALSRGNATTRLLTFKNISWSPKKIKIVINEDLGLAKRGAIQVQQLHPTERYLGQFQYGDSVEVVIDPFRASLIVATAEVLTAPVLIGAPYQTVRATADGQHVLEVLGQPGSEINLKLKDHKNFISAKVNGNPSKALLSGENVKMSFSGASLKLPVHRKLGDFAVEPIPSDAKALYEATIYAADNNALEVRSSERSGESRIPQVIAARSAFFNQDAFVSRSIWDRNLFDGSMQTGFGLSKKYNIDQSISGGALRVDLGEIVVLDSLKIHVINEFLLQPLLQEEGNFVDYSTDLVHWKRATFLAGTTMVIELKDSVRYLKFLDQPQHMVEMEGYAKGQKLNTDRWRVSNLFAATDKMKCQQAWKMTTKLPEVANGSYLCVAINGTHGVEGAYAALKIDGKMVGAPDRAPSYPSNTWEYVNERSDKNYTYYFPISAADAGKTIEAFVLGYQKSKLDLTPQLWITNNSNYTQKIRLELVRKP